MEDTLGRSRQSCQIIKGFRLWRWESSSNVLTNTPAHYIILLAAERIGTAIICRDDIPKNYVSRSESLNPTLLL